MAKKQKIVQYEEDPDDNQIEQMESEQTEILDDDAKSTPRENEWVKMSNGQFFQIKSQESSPRDQPNAYFDPTYAESQNENERVQNNSKNAIENGENPYASINLEETVNQAEKEAKKESDQAFVDTTNPHSGVFDENIVDFQLESGVGDIKLQSDAIFASASMKETDEAIPLNCQWYNIRIAADGKHGGLTLIENASGACFQPSIQDVGTKICVHALPAENDALQDQYQGMPLFAEVGPLELDPILKDEADQIIKDTTSRSERNYEDSGEGDDGQKSAAPKEFKIMAVNKFKCEIQKEDENGDKVPDGAIQLIKKNMKIPSTIKLVGIMTEKTFDIYRKNKVNDGPLIRVMYSQNISYEIIRHTNTRIILRETNTESELTNEIEFTLESSYQRDLFALVFQQLNENYLEQISKSDLKEVDFFKRREAYLEKQISSNIAKHNQDLKDEKAKHKNQLAQKDTLLQEKADIITEKDALIEQMKQQIQGHVYQIHQLFNEREGLWMQYEDMACRSFEKQQNSEKVIEDLQNITESLNEQLASATQDLQFAEQDNQIYKVDIAKLKKKLQKAEKKISQNNQVEICLTESEQDHENSGDRNSIAASQSQGASSSVQSSSKSNKQCQTDELPSQTVYFNYDHMVGKDKDQGELIDKYRSELNLLKKAQISYQNEKSKILTKLQNFEKMTESRQNTTFCSGCKVELLFASDRSPGKPRSKSDSEESLKTELTQIEQNDQLEEDAGSHPLDTQITIAENMPTKIKKQDSKLSRTEQNHMDALQLLADENNEMKIQIQEQIRNANHFKFMMEEYKHVVDEELLKSNQYKSLMLLTQQNFKSSMFQTANNTEMQKLIQQLTIVVTERDEQLSMEKTLARQLRQSLDEQSRELAKYMGKVQ